MAPTWHRNLPWDWIRNKYRQFKIKHFEKDPPSWGYAEVKASELEIVMKLGSMSYASNGNWLSYYKGEDINLARVFPITWEHIDQEIRDNLKPYLDGDRVDYVWFQTHMRAWKMQGNPAQYKINGHLELEPFFNDSAHIDGIGYNRKKGMRTIIEDMEDLNIDVIEYPDFFDE